MTSTRRRVAIILVASACLVAVCAAVVRWQQSGLTITAHFSAATAIYPGDEVRVAGVRVGTIESIEPDGDQARVTLTVDRGVPIPAEAGAIIMAQNLISARFIALTPAYETEGPVMSDGAVIGLDRTAVPVEWDEVKEQLTRMATDVGPQGDLSATALSRFIDTAADAMDGNGVKLREAISQMSGVGRVLADGSGDLVEFIKNLDVFVSALRESNTQVVQFQDRMASLTSVVDGGRSDLDAVLKNLSTTLADVQRFVAGSRDATTEQVQRLAAVTQNVADNRLALENVLHTAPNAIVNGYNIYSADTGTAMGAFAFANFSNPLQAVCAAIGAVENITAAETAKRCAEYLGPALRLLNFNYMPFPFNAYLAKAPSPHNLVYSDPALAPGGAGGVPVPPETPPAVSAFTGAGDVTPPAGWNLPPGAPGIHAPGGLPAAPTPALFPGAPVSPGPPPAVPPTSIADMLLPAEAPAASSPTPAVP